MGVAASSAMTDAQQRILGATVTDTDAMQEQARATCRQAAFYAAELDTSLPAGAIAAKFFPKEGAALRDPCGGTVLHWCMLLGAGEPGRRSRVHRSIAMHFIQSPEVGVEVLNLTFNIREGTPGDKPVPYALTHFDGQTALHIAVAKNDPELVEALLDRKVAYKTRAYGSFFAPGADKHCYFGEYALSFAAASGADDICRLIIRAYPNAVEQYDSFGNTAFHLAILHRHFGTYKVLVDEWVRTGRAGGDRDAAYQRAASLRGALGLTPLSMAACMRDGVEPETPSSGEDPLDALVAELKKRDDDVPTAALFQQVLGTMCAMSWAYGSVAAYSCPLEQIDTLRLLDRDGSPTPEAQAVTLIPQVRDGSAPATPGATPVLPATEPIVNFGIDSDSGSDDEVVAEGARGVQVRSSCADCAPSFLNRLMGALTKNVEENTAYHSVLSLTLNYDLHHMADAEVITEVLLWKWNSVKWVYYTSIVYHMCYLTVLTVFAVSEHAKFKAEYAYQREVLMWVAFGMGTAGLVPFVYDVFAGVAYSHSMKQMREQRVCRKNCPKQLEENPEAWREYQAKEGGAVPPVAGMQYYQAFEAFPLSGFDLCSLFSYVLLVTALILRHTTWELPSTNSTATAENATDGAAGAGDDIPDPYAYSVILGLASMFAWVSSLTFAPVHPRLGNVVTMMMRTIVSDVLPFTIVFAALLGGFAVAMYCLLHSGYTFNMVLEILKDAYLPVTGLNMQLKSWGPGEEGPEDARGPSTEVWIAFAYILMLVFTLLTSLLMLNLFIAALTSTYEDVKTHASQEWKLQWGRDVLLLERRLHVLPHFCDRLRMNHGSPEQHLQLQIRHHHSPEYTQDDATAAAGTSPSLSAPGSPAVVTPTLRQQLRSRLAGELVR